MFTLNELETIALALAMSDLDPGGKIEAKVDQMIADYVRSIDEYRYSYPR